MRPSPALLLVVLGLGSAARCEDDAPLVPRRDLHLIARARRRAQAMGPVGGNGARRCEHKRTFYRDSDGDGFGDRAKPVTACAPPPGFVANGDDCYDRNRHAHPGQRDYFAEQRGDGSFDYDCDGQATRRFTSRAYCREKESGGCDFASGWVGKKIPRCGEPAEFAWKVCRKQVVISPPSGDADAGVPVHTPGALIPGAKQQVVYRCGGRKLPWKKRQLCR